MSKTATIDFVLQDAINAISMPNYYEEQRQRDELVASLKVAQVDLKKLLTDCLNLIESDDRSDVGPVDESYRRETVRQLKSALKETK
jgi:hypothetical protein